jgi:PilZ domain
MDRIAQEKRATRRYELHLPIHFRVSQKGAIARWGAGVTREMSTTGLSFRSRKPLPIGSHVEMIIDWPARYAENQPIDLQLTGFVVRSDNNRTAVRVTSRRFRINSSFEPYRATA